MFRILHAGDTLQAQREIIIEDLYTKVSLLELSVTIVFDSQYQGGEESSRSHRQHLEILFTAKGETADDLILDLVKKTAKPEQTIVVTSDKKLAWLVRRRSGKTEPVEEFISWLNKRYQNKLRHQKEKLKPIIDDIVPKKIIRKKVVSKPSLKATPEECADFYLNTFEKQYVEANNENKSGKKLSQPKKKTKKKVLPKKLPELSVESDGDRWLKAFENPSTNEESFIEEKD